jgi:hypothetical protein
LVGKWSEVVLLAILRLESPQQWYNDISGTILQKGGARVLGQSIQVSEKYFIPPKGALNHPLRRGFKLKKSPQPFQVSREARNCVNMFRRPRRGERNRERIIQMRCHLL